MDLSRSGNTAPSRGVCNTSTSPLQHAAPAQIKHGTHSTTGLLYLVLCTAGHLTQHNAEKSCTANDLSLAAARNQFHLVMFKRQYMRMPCTPNKL